MSSERRRAQRDGGRSEGWLWPVYRLYALRLYRQVRRGPLPRHVAVILDGNRRFARERRQSWTEGYRHGADRIDDVLRWSDHLGIEVVTLWAMSIENLQRPSEQVSALAEVIAGKLDELTDLALRHGWRLRGIGRRDLLPPRLRASLDRAEERTRESAGLIVQFAIGYDGRAEIIDAVRRFIAAAPAGASPDAALARLTPDTLATHLYSAGLPDPDLILRTSGELRLSGFLLWQSANAEFYFTDVLWPDFREVDFLRALRDFAARDRRFGR